MRTIGRRGCKVKEQLGGLAQQSQGSYTIAVRGLGTSANIGTRRQSSSMQASQARIWSQPLWLKRACEASLVCHPVQVH